MFFGSPRKNSVKSLYYVLQKSFRVTAKTLKHRRDPLRSFWYYGTKNDSTKSWCPSVQSESISDTRNCLRSWRVFVQKNCHWDKKISLENCYNPSPSTSYPIMFSISESFRNTEWFSYVMHCEAMGFRQKTYHTWFPARKIPRLRNFRNTEWFPAKLFGTVRQNFREANTEFQPSYAWKLLTPKFISKHSRVPLRKKSVL